MDLKKEFLSNRPLRRNSYNKAHSLWLPNLFLYEKVAFRTTKHMDIVKSAQRNINLIYYFVKTIKLNI